MNFRLASLAESDARAILSWRYEPPYDIYNPDPAEFEEDLARLTAAEYQYFAVHRAGELIAFRCFGVEAQVPGGRYEEDALDMGGGLRPDLTDQGWGPQVMQAAIGFARQQFDPPLFRVTVAEFNLRAIKACQKAGYQPVDRFVQKHSSRPFIIMTRS